MMGVEKLKSYFRPDTMSVHLKEGAAAKSKVGAPGDWHFDYSDQILSREEIEQLAVDLVEQAGQAGNGFVEAERNGSTILQIGDLRIVVARPPFSNAWEITAVRPIVSLELEDYELSEKLSKRVAQQAEGILIAGAPGMGKSTFSAAMARYYAAQAKIVKTLEAPRDLHLNNNEIVQYALTHADTQEICDILLLSRPDYVIFDEMRSTDDFRLFSDLRLAGVGLLGIVHATAPVDAIQRFLGRIDLGVIPQVIDTVIFIRDGRIAKVFDLRMEVKVPFGMFEADLARPVVTVRDFETQKLEYEVYSYGEEAVVVPVVEEKDKQLFLLARGLEKEFERYADVVKVSMLSKDRCTVQVPEKSIAKIIGKKGQNIESMQQQYGISIDVLPLEEERKRLNFSVKVTEKNINFLLAEEFADNHVDIHVNDDYCMTAKVGKKGVIKVRTGNRLGTAILDAIRKKEDVKLLL